MFLLFCFYIVTVLSFCFYIVTVLSFCSSWLASTAAAAYLLRSWNVKFMHSRYLSLMNSVNKCVWVWKAARWIINFVLCHFLEETEISKLWWCCCCLQCQRSCKMFCWFYNYTTITNKIPLRSFPTFPISVLILQYKRTALDVKENSKWF